MGALLSALACASCIDHADHTGSALESRTAPATSSLETTSVTAPASRLRLPLPGTLPGAVSELRDNDEIYARADTVAIGTLETSTEVDSRGNATAQVVLPVAPAPNGMGPSVSLVYSSGRGNGPLGMGWAMSAGQSSIRRGPRTIEYDGRVAPPEFLPHDPLYLDGQRLILVSGGHGMDGAVYGMHNAPQSRVVLHVQTTGTWFELWTGDGLRRRYGFTYRSRALDADERPYEWMLEEIRDRRDNTIAYSWHRSVDNQGATVRMLLQSIQYTGGPNQGALRSVVFTYEDRPSYDRTYTFFFGVPQWLDRRLARVESFGPSGHRYARYTLHYTDDMATRRTLLARVRRYDGELHELPGVQLGWRMGEAGFDDAAPDRYPGEWADQDGDENFPDTVGRMATGDFDGDGVAAEVVFAQDVFFAPLGEEGIEQSARNSGYTWHMWSPHAAELEDTGYLMYGAAKNPNLAEQPDFGVFAANFGNRGPDSLVVPYSHECSAPNNYDVPPDRHTFPPCAPMDESANFYATRFYTLRRGRDGWVRENYDDGSDEHIYTFLVEDLDGDTQPDIAVCRGNDYRDSRWAFGRSILGHELSFDFFESTIRCSPSDEYTVVDYDGDGASEVLAIQAWRVSAGGAERVPDAERTGYRAIEVDFDGESAYLTDPVLPRDLYQRWRGAGCAHTYSQTPDRSAGPSIDKLTDYNADGLQDILRFELTAGDGYAQIAQIKSVFNPDAVPGQIETECVDLDSLEEEAGIRVYYNTGAGFRAGPFIQTFDHPAYFRTHFRPAVTIDWNADGRGDLWLPPLDRSPYDTGPMDLLRSEGHYSVHEDTDVEWPYMLDPLANGARFTTSLDLNGDGLRDYVMRRMGYGSWPMDVHVKRGTDRPDVLTSLTDGLGATSSFVYSRENVFITTVTPGPTAPARSPRPVVLQLFEDQGLQGSHRVVTTYGYAEGLIDRYGRGHLGFGRITSSSYPEHNPALRDEVVTSYDQVYDETRDAYPTAGNVTYRLRTVTATQPDADRLGASATRTLSYVESSEHRTRSSSLSSLLWFSYLHQSTDAAFDTSESPLSRHVSTQVVDGWGNVTFTTVTYDDGQVSTTTNVMRPVNLPSWFLGQTERTIQEVRDPHGVVDARTVAYDYYSNGSLRQTVREPDGGDTIYQAREFEYDHRGNVTRATVRTRADVRSVRTYFDSEGFRPEREVNSLAHVSYSVHDPLTGELLASVDPNGVTDAYRYDGIGRLVEHERRAWPSTDSQVGEGGTLEIRQPTQQGAAYRTIVRASDGSDVVTEFDRDGQPIYSEWPGFASGSTPNGNPLQRLYRLYRYDHRGLLTLESAPTPVTEPAPMHWRTYYYDNAGRQTAVRNYDMTMTRTARVGLSEVRVDELGRQLVLTQNSRGQIVETLDAQGMRSEYRYTPFGALARAIVNTNQHGNAAGRATIFEHDSWNRRTAVNSPDRGRQSYALNGLDEVVSITNPGNQVVQFDYDDLGRLLSRSSGGSTDSYAYDTEKLGLPASETSAYGVVTSYAYDDLARLTSTTVQVAGGTHTLALDYDSVGRVAYVTYPSAGPGAPRVMARNTYNWAGQLCSVARVPAFNSAGSTVWSLEAANEWGSPTQERFGNGQRTYREYDPVTGRLTGIRTEDDQGALRQRLRYDYYDDGRLELRSDLRSSQSERFQYDSMGRLIHAISTRGTRVLDREVRYDPFGNITNRSDVGSYTYEGGQLRFAGSQEYLYDARGRVRERPGVDRLFWTGTGQLWRIQNADSTRLDFMYDADDQRVRRVDTATGTTTLTLFGGLYERVSSPSGTTHRYGFENGRRTVATIEMTQAPGGAWSERRYYVHDDHLGSTHVVTNEDGNFQERVSYDAWGRERPEHDWTQISPGAFSSVDHTNIGFTGHRASLDRGLIDMRGRHYDPVIGRFISPDPVVFDVFNSQAHNAYSYVADDPVNLTDPTGFFPEGEDESGDVVIREPGRPVRVILVEPFQVVGRRDQAGGTGTAPREDGTADSGPDSRPGTDAPDGDGGFSRGDVGSAGQHGGVDIRPMGPGFEPYQIPLSDRSAFRGLSQYQLDCNFARGACTVNASMEGVALQVVEGRDQRSREMAIGTAKIYAEGALWAVGIGVLARAGRYAIPFLMRAGARGVNGLRVGGTRVRVPGCFVGDTLIATPDGEVPIRDIAEGDLVIAWNATLGASAVDFDAHRALRVTTRDAAETVDVTPEAYFYVDRRGWTSVCRLLGGERIALASGGWTAVHEVAGTCEAPSVEMNAPEPDPHAEVVVLSHSRTAARSATIRSLGPGEEAALDGTLIEVRTPSRIVVAQPSIDAEARLTADGVFDGAVLRLSERSTVRTLGRESRYTRLGFLSPGDEFSHAGVIYRVEGASSSPAIAVSDGRVVSRVVRTITRSTSGINALTVEDRASGAVSTLRGTPEHPFYLERTHEYVPLNQLVVGDALRTDAGVGVVVAHQRLEGDYTVFNFEVEDEHNYFVADSEGSAASVLVHNGNCAQSPALRGSPYDPARAAAAPTLTQNIVADMRGLGIAPAELPAARSAVFGLIERIHRLGIARNEGALRAALPAHEVHTLTRGELAGQISVDLLPNARQAFNSVRLVINRAGQFFVRQTHRRGR